MNINKLSYTGRDISAIRSNIISMIPSLSDSWTDFNESDIGMVLIEVLAGVTDMLGFYLDKQALETYLPTVTQTKNAKALLTLVNQKLHMTTSSTCTVEFRLNDEFWDHDIIIPRYTRISTRGEGKSVKYVTSRDTYIPRGSTSVLTPAIQGDYQEVKLKVKDLTKQKILLPSNSVALGSVTLVIGDTPWTEVTDVFLTNRSAKEFSVHEDKNDMCYIKLSYGYEDLLPTYKDTEVLIRYVNSLGSQGKVGVGTLSNLLDELRDSEGNHLGDKVTVLNIEPSSGGSDRQSIESAREDIPQVVRTMHTAVTLEDYEILTKNFPGVLKAKTLDWSVDGGYVTRPYRVDAYVVPTDGEEVSQSLINDLQNEIRKRSVSSNTYTVYPAKYVPVDIVADVNISGSKDLAEDIRRGLENELEEYFSAKNQDFGKGYRVSNIYTLIQTYHPSINYVELKHPTTNTVLNLNEFPKLGELSITVTIEGSLDSRYESFR